GGGGAGGDQRAGGEGAERGCQDAGDPRDAGLHGRSHRRIAGGCNTGGRSGGTKPFSTSSFSMSSDGADADTGTQPLSAPHTPLKVSISRLAARIDCSATSGVPLMSMPRTSSRRPSGYS